MRNKAVNATAAALKRLNNALERLERAAAHRGNGGGPEIAALRQEADDLARRHAALKKSAGQVATRLDDTIRRLSNLMDEG
jgi:hypothetical protein